MSSLVDNQNMYGLEIPTVAFSVFDNQNMYQLEFAEVPADAFSVFDLSMVLPRPLPRTYKATCTICLDRCHTSDSNNRFSVCCICNSRRIPLMQSFIRRYLVCKKLKRIRNQELAYRWFTTKDINGGDFSRLIGSFL